MNDRRRWALAALATGVVVAIVRRWTSRDRDEYAIWPDEPAQLAIARFLGGGTRWNMDDHSVWRPLFGTLLAPAHWFTDDPVAILHVALVLNAVLGGVAAALLVLLARRLTPLSPWPAAGAAAVVSLAPGVVFTTDFVFSESLVAPLFLGTLLALLRFRETPQLGSGLTAALLAGASFATHSRMLPLALIVLGVVLLAALRRRIAVSDAAIVAGVTTATVVAVELYTRWIVGRLWDEPSTRNSPSAVLEQLTSGLPVLVSLLGQGWYLLVATLGIVVYGLVVLSHRAVSRDGRDAAGDARIVLVAVGACVALSVVFMSDRLRSDQLVYGRYNDAVVTPILVVGVAALVGAIPLRRLVGIAATSSVAIMLGGVALWGLRRDVLAGSNGLEPMILGLQPYATSATSIDVIRISAWAAVLTLALGGIATLRAPNRRRAVFASLSVLLAVGWLRTSAIIDTSWDDAGDLSAVRQLSATLQASGDTVDFYLAPGNTSTNRMMAYQFHLPHTEFIVVNGPDDATSQLVFARLDDDDRFTDPDDRAPRLVWSDPRGRYGLFRR